MVQTPHHRVQKNGHVRNGKQNYLWQLRNLPSRSRRARFSPGGGLPLLHGPADRAVPEVRLRGRRLCAEDKPCALVAHAGARRRGAVDDEGLGAVRCPRQQSNRQAQWHLMGNN
jgi:hypothetical protein